MISKGRLKWITQTAGVETYDHQFTELEVQYRLALRDLLADRDQLIERIDTLECDHPSSDGTGQTYAGESVMRCGICKRAHISVRLPDGFDHTINLHLLARATANTGERK